MHHFLTQWVICFGGYLFVHTPIFSKYLNFCVFLSGPHLLDNYAKIVDERGRNIMNDRTLRSLLVFSTFNKLFYIARMTTNKGFTNNY